MAADYTRAGGSEQDGRQKACNWDARHSHSEPHREVVGDARGRAVDLLLFERADLGAAGPAEPTLNHNVAGEAILQPVLLTPANRIVSTGEVGACFATADTDGAPYSAFHRGLFGTHSGALIPREERSVKANRPSRHVSALSSAAW